LYRLGAFPPLLCPSFSDASQEPLETRLGIAWIVIAHLAVRREDRGWHRNKGRHCLNRQCIIRPMCSGVDYRWRGRTIRAYFPDPRAMLPVLLRSGEDKLLPWGRREAQPGRLPPGGWARQDSIHRGVWAKWNPRPVLLDVHRWMETDYDGNPHWYDLDPCQFIQGLVAHAHDEQRVYVVTIVPLRLPGKHPRLPHIVVRKGCA
jgi:hypothetical protein